MTRYIAIGRKRFNDSEMFWCGHAHRSRGGALRCALRLRLDRRLPAVQVIETPDSSKRRRLD